MIRAKWFCAERKPYEREKFNVLHLSWVPSERQPAEAARAPMKGSAEKKGGKNTQKS